MCMHLVLMCMALCVVVSRGGPAPGASSRPYTVWQRISRTQDMGQLSATCMSFGGKGRTQDHCQLSLRCACMLEERVQPPALSSGSVRVVNPLLRSLQYILKHFVYMSMALCFVGSTGGLEPGSGRPYTARRAKGRQWEASEIWLLDCC